MSIEVRGLKYVYHQGTPIETVALDGINISIRKGEWLTVVGHTGSGKSTFAQHLNALIFPQFGQIDVDGITLEPKSDKLRQVRQKVGLVFQYPEQQLFAETISEEIAFAPRNWGVDPDSIPERVDMALSKVGLDASFKSRSPFRLSGGERRRVAIASVLSANPSYLVLDEPTAGLDAEGRMELTGLLAALREDGLGIVLITHDLELALSCSEKILILEKGNQIFYGTPDGAVKLLIEQPIKGLILPEVVRLSCELLQRGWKVPVTSDEFVLADAIVRMVKS
jgi:energy-coupling factor transport system ATP-binding protein